MAPAKSVEFRPANSNEKRIAILAVVAFNDANGITNYSRPKVAEFYGVHERTARKWCAAATSSSTSTSSLLLAQEPEDNGSAGLKREKSVEFKEEPTSAPASSLAPNQPQPAAPKRKNPVRNDGRGRKKLKSIVEHLAERDSSASPPLLATPSPAYSSSSSPTPPQQLLTPPGRKMAQVKSRRPSSQQKLQCGSGNHVVDREGKEWEDENEDEV
jgi:hypothetical protein